MAETIGNGNQTAAGNEFEFSKTKGFGSMNYGLISSKVTVNQENFLVENKSQWFFFIRKKQKPEIIPYEKIDKVEVKTNFAKGDFIFAAIFLLVSLITAQWWGLVVVAVLVFCAYGKNIVITRKDTSSNVIIMSEGFGQTKNIDEFCKAIQEKGNLALGNPPTVTNQPKNPIKFVLAGAAAAIILMIISSLVISSNSVDGPLREYDKLADDAIELVNNADDQDITKTLGKLARLQQKITELTEKLDEIEDEMTEEQMERFFEITLKMASIGEF
jgi:hypothetical protein